MSAISSVNVVAAPGRRGVALSSTNKRSSVRAKASLSDKFKELKDKLPDVSGVKLPDGLPNFGGDSSSSGGGGDGEGIGYEPKGGGDKLYVGAGKYIEDDKIGILSGTGRDGGQITGGFAGGEVGFQKYRELLAEDEDLTWERARGRAPVYEPVYGGRKGSDEVSLAKDFGGMAGGFPGGEIGVMSYNATGEVATRDAPPTVGWGPPVFLLASIATAGYFLNPGDPSEELGAAVTAAAGAKAAVDGILSPEQEVVLAQAGAVGVGLVLAGAAITAAAKQAGAAVGNGLKVGLLGAAALAVAGKVLEIY